MLHLHSVILTAMIVGINEIDGNEIVDLLVFLVAQERHHCDDISDHHYFPVALQDC